MKTQVSAQAKKLFASLALAAIVAPVWAATQTVTLSVPGMTCSACPITVKKAISKVEGVSKVDVTFETRQAVVTFDDATGRWLLKRPADQSKDLGSRQRPFLHQSIASAGKAAGKAQVLTLSGKRQLHSMRPRLQ